MAEPVRTPVPLPSIWTLLEQGCAPSQINGRIERDTSGDMTDEQIAELL